MTSLISLWLTGMFWNGFTFFKPKIFMLAKLSMHGFIQTSVTINLWVKVCVMGMQCQTSNVPCSHKYDSHTYIFTGVFELTIDFSQHYGAILYW